MILYILSILLGAAGAWFVSRHGRRFNLLDHPNDRSSHHCATPRGGGVGILAGFIVAAAVLGLSATFWVPAAVLAAISFWEDRFEIAPLYRLLFQFAAGSVVLIGIGKAHPPSLSGYLIFLFFLIFIVATANYYNFMDGIDGIAGISGALGFGLLGFYSFSTGADPAVLTLGICLALGCLGFLPFNFPRARVFMGDVGSILLGFVFAVVVIRLSENVLDFICLASFLFPFYADELTTEAVRLKDGEKLWQPHRRHFYQILANEHGMAHWKISAGYGLGQMLVGLSCLLLKNQGLVPVLLIILLYFSIFVGVSTRMRKKLEHRLT